MRLLCAHAGGAICTIADRLDFGHELRGYGPLGPWGEVELPEPPSAYVARLFLDTVTYGTAALLPALARVGHEQVLYGSDRPPVPFDLERTTGYVRELGLPAARGERDPRRQRAAPLPAGMSEAAGSGRWSGADELVEVALTLNGAPATLAAKPRWTLADSLRESGLTGTHLGCEHGVCGACTVLVDDEPVRSCLVLAVQAEGARVETVEALADGDDLHAGAARVPGRARPAVRLLHAGLRRARGLAAAPRARRRARSASARCSRPTSAAAPATRRSSRP